MSQLWVDRRKEPILGYVPKNGEKKNSEWKGLITLKKNVCFYFLVHFSMLIPILESVFYDRNQKISIIQNFFFSWLSEVSRLGRLKWTLDLDSTGQKNTGNNFSSIRKNPAIPKIQSRLFRMLCYYSNREKG